MESEYLKKRTRLAALPLVALVFLAFPTGLSAQQAAEDQALKDTPSAGSALLPEQPAVAPLGLQPTPAPSPAPLPSPAPAPIMAEPTPQPVASPAPTPAPAPTSDAQGSGLEIERTAAPDPAPAPEPAPQPIEVATAAPLLPETPTLGDTPYPDCRPLYQDQTEDIARAQTATDCIEQLDIYNETVLLPFRDAMIAHQDALSRVYEEQVLPSSEYSYSESRAIYTQIMQEHADSNEDGPYFAEHRAAEARYTEDRAVLLERFCRYSGCPRTAEQLAASPARDAEDNRIVQERLAERRAVQAEQERVAQNERRERRSRGGGGGGSNDCSTEQAGGGLFGAILGGVIGAAAGDVATGALVGGAVGVLAGDFACRLSEREQIQATEATLEATRSEQVGATSTWVSEDREDVSGSATVTSIAMLDNGTSCMDVTNVVIIEGEEERVANRMCRAPGEPRYTLQA